MAYKKFIKRGGKIFGPYYYESYRDKSGKVKKKYVGTTDPNKGKSVGDEKWTIGKEIFLFFLIFFGILSLMVVFRGVTANVVSDIIEEDVFAKFDNDVFGLSIRTPVIFGDEVLNKNKNKRMDFDLGSGNLRLYFDIVNYSEVVDGVEGIIESENVSIVAATGNFVRGLTGFAVGKESGKSKVNKDKIKEKIEELDVDEIEIAVEDAVVEAEDFDIIVDEFEDSGYKWGYEVRLSDLNFMAKIEVTSTDDILIWDDSTLRVGDSLLSFSDLVAEGYMVRIERPAMEMEVLEVFANDTVVLNETISNETIIDNKTFANDTVVENVTDVLNETIVEENETVIDNETLVNDTIVENETVEEEIVENITEEVVDVGITGSLVRGLSGLVIGEADDLVYENSVSVYIERDFSGTGYRVGDMIYLDPTLVVINISKAEHLDSNRTFIEDIYEEVREQDGNWSSVIGDGEYVRVTFEENLTSDKDITIYARGVWTLSQVPSLEGNVSVGNQSIPYEVYSRKKRIDEIRRLLDG